MSGGHTSKAGHPRSLPLFDEGGFVDRLARRVSYLRVSLTDRCNYRCQYCMPEEGVDLVPRAEVLTLEEIVRVVAAMRLFGVRRVRLTGGEPTIRRGLVELVRALAALGLDDLAMTTNGHRLEELARPLKDAGLARLNVSVDTLDAHKFRALTRRGDLDAVLRGLEAARAAGFAHTKLNAVVMGGVNDGDDLIALCRFAWSRRLVPRFIEFMPMSDGALFAPGSFVPAAEIRARLSAAFGPLDADEAEVPGVGPARYLRVRLGEHAGARVGMISAVSEPFCETCNRVRLSATGRLHTCLAHDDDTDLRPLLRSGASDAELRERIRIAVANKRDGHEFTGCGGGAPRKHMVAIGG
jgi:cyclic pyranopterin phosphate synthase